MAEAHSAVAFSFTVTHEGVDVNLNHDALNAVWKSGIGSWKKRLGRAKNKFKNGAYPASPISLLFVATIVLALRLGGVDPSLGIIDGIKTYTPGMSIILSDHLATYASCIIFSTILWFSIILLLKYTLKLLLTYHGWMFDGRGKISLKTKLWIVLVRVLGGKKPLLMSYQSSLPNLPLPSVNQTIEKYLLSVRPLMDDEKYQTMEKLANDFKNGLGKKLQRYLWLKSWWSTNYVSDWWEEYVYLRGRSPIMVNSNFYGVDAVLVHPTKIQAARAGNIVYCMLQYRRELDREELNPLLLNKTVPLCSAQYERQFNTTRIPGIDTDQIVHYKDSKHIVVYHRGRYFKVYIHFKGRLLKPCELERTFQKILDDPSNPAEGEEQLAALTAGERAHWAQTRKEFFFTGKNKASLDAIEKAAFFLTFDDEPQEFDRNDPSSFDRFGHCMLHGKGYDRWFDKSFSLVITSNGRIGFNAEHSWADAPIMAHLWEYSVTDDHQLLGYRPDGHTLGEPEMTSPNPIRLEWELKEPCIQAIESSYQVAKKLLEDVDLRILMFDNYGKGFMKKCKTSPDAYIQMALQLTYYRDAGKFCLTYESSMTRLFREGRTETVRPCTMESCEFVRAMDDETKTNAERIAALTVAADQHQMAYRDTMTGAGIDRHLFCLYVVSKYIGIDSPFLTEVLSEPWRLSTSQTPHQQTEKLDLVKHPEHISGGGGFGPVADDGYGVSYIIAGEDVVFFHVSCKKSCPTTDASRFCDRLVKALGDIKELFDKK
ncbi:hypothetical protein ACJMK2_029858 [Sinanodonta woodiana]|uniref:carnitine O-palmitoyltransferase n=1 Tax=Sinanodonta woodiana TaxID=1069815 RepID=A0ABD3XF59_SINWO